MIAEFDLIVDGINKSKQLLALSKSEEWEQFVELEERRQMDLAKLHLDGLELTPEQYAKIHSKMEELIDLNSQLETTCLQRKAEISKQVQKISQGNKATKAYSQ